MFQHYWCATLLACVRACVCVCVCARTHICTQIPACTVLQPIKFQQQRSDICPHTVFSVIATLWECSALVKSTVQCQPIKAYRGHSPPLCWIYKQQQPSHMCLWISACWHPSTARNSITTLWSCSDGFTTWYAFYKLHCNVVHTSYSSSQLYCSAQVSVTVFTTSSIEAAIFRVDASEDPHINLALGRLWVWVCVRGRVGKQPELSAEAHTVLWPSFTRLECGYRNVCQNVRKPSSLHAHFMHITSSMNNKRYIKHRHFSRSSDDIAKMSHTTLLCRVPQIQVSVCCNWSYINTSSPPPVLL